MFPPAVNWNYAQVATIALVNKQPLCVFASKECLSVIDITNRRCIGTLYGHSARVSAVICAAQPHTLHTQTQTHTHTHRDTYTNVVISGDENGNIRVWDLVKMSCIQSYTLAQCHTVSALCTVFVQSESQQQIESHQSDFPDYELTSSILIISGDITGCLHAWNMHTQTEHQLNTSIPIKNPIFCMTSSPSQSLSSLCSRIAIGYRNGSVCICNALTGDIIERLAGHTDQVHSIAWQPVWHKHTVHQSDSKRSQSPSRSPSSPSSSSSSSSSSPSSSSAALELLLSSSKDGSMRIWDTSHQGVLLASHSSTTQSKSTHKQNRLWHSSQWSAATANQIIAAGTNGVISVLNVHITEDAKHVSISAPVMFPKIHTRPVFAVCSVLAQPHQLVSLSMDRLICVSDLQHRKLMWDIAGLGGYANDIHFHPSSLHLAAIALGDNSVKIWNTASQSNRYHTTALWRGFQSKITVIRWHPTLSSCFAYGTDSGQVVVFDQTSGSHTHCSMRHKGTVYSLTWHGEDLYSIGAGHALLLWKHAIGAARKQQQDVCDLSKELKCTDQKGKPADLCWNDDGWLAIGRTDGVVNVLHDGKVLNTFTKQSHCIHALRWHPTTSQRHIAPHSLQSAVDFANWVVADVAEVTTHHNHNETQKLRQPCASWLASGAEDGSIVVYCCGDSDAKEQKSIVLAGHRVSITGLEWHPTISNLLCSCSNDRSIQVWDVLTQQPVLNLRGHVDRVLCVQWNPLDPLELVSGSQDQTLRVWNLADSALWQHKTPPAAPPRKRGSRSRGKGKGKHNNASKFSTRAKKAHSKAANSDEKKVAIATAGGTTDVYRRAKRDRRRAMFQSFPSISRADMQQSCRELLKEHSVDMKSSKVEESSSIRATTATLLDHLHRNEALQAVHSESVRLEQMRNRPRSKGATSTSGDISSINRMHHLFHQHAAIWQGDLRQVLHQHVKAQTLSAHLVAQSASLGHGVWVQVCRAYAKQLEMTGDDPHQAVLYHLSLHDVHEAVNVYLRFHMFADAVALAQVRMPEFDPLISECWVKYGEHCLADGRTEQAAKCFWSAGQFTGALNALMSKDSHNVTMLELAHELVCARNAKTTVVDSAWDQQCAQLVWMLSLCYMNEHMWVKLDSVLATTAAPEQAAELSLLSQVHRQLVQADDEHTIDDVSLDASLVGCRKKLLAQLENTHASVPEIQIAIVGTIALLSPSDAADETDELIGSVCHRIVPAAANGSWQREPLELIARMLRMCVKTPFGPLSTLWEHASRILQHTISTEDAQCALDALTCNGALDQAVLREHLAQDQHQHQHQQASDDQKHQRNSLMQKLEVQQPHRPSALQAVQIGMRLTHLKDYATQKLDSSKQRMQSSV
jgi:WD40 repeat protein